MTRLSHRRVLTALLFVLIFLCCPSARGADTGPVLTVNFNRASLEEVMATIEKDTPYRFSYRSSLLDDGHKVTYKGHNVTVETVLDAALAGSGIRYEIVSSRSIVLSKMPVASGAGDKRRISGIVSDTGGEPLIGASVKVPGADTGVVTDIDGAFSIEVGPETDAVEVSYVGFMSSRFAIGAADNYNFELRPNVAALDEVVVVGYGTQRKSVVTAAISGVKADDLKAVTPVRVDNALKGMVSGVSITAASGQPGEGSLIRIRGTGTINDSNPLYIVDGMAMNGGIEYLNPTDIKSIEVLKDAASAAIYGSRGANGVILVTTKKGADNSRTEVNYGFSYGIQNPWRKLRMLNATEYATIINEMALNDGGEPVYENPSLFGNGTNWQNEIFNRNAPIINHQLSVSGGNSKINYYFSASYLYQEGIIGGNFNQSNYERFTVRANNNYTLFDIGESRSWLRNMKMGSNISYTHDSSHSIASNSERGSVLGAALALSPMMPVYAEDPDALLASHPYAVVDASGRPYAIAGDEFAAMPNPLALLRMPNDKNLTDKVVGSLNLDLEVFKGLTWRTMLSGDLAIYTNDGYSIPYYLNSNRQNDTSSVWATITKTFSWQVENTLSYTFDIQKEHNFTVLLGQSAYDYTDCYVSGTSYLIRDYTQPWIDATDQDPKQRSAYASPSPHRRLASYFGRLSYDYLSRYMLELTIRRDGSSNFSPRNKWANFPSVSAGWNITNEPFMEGRPTALTSMKLRASWGKNGNQNIRAFAYTSMMQGGADYIFGLNGNSAIAPGAVPVSYSNANLRWEESEQTDVGFDAGFFNGRFEVGLDYYYKRTNGMLMEMALPSYIGNNRPLGNVGDMSNTGFEFDLSFHNRFGEFNFNAGINGSYNRNKLIRLGNESGTLNYDEVHGNLGVVSRAENGQPFPFFYGWRTDGIFQTKEQVAAYVNSAGELLQPYAVPGDVIFVDVNGDGVIDDGDRTKIGKGMPDWTFGLNLGVEWRGIDLSLLFHSTLGNDIYDATRRADYPMVNMPAYMLDRWCGPGSSYYLPRVSGKANGGPNQNWRSSDIMVYDGSFLRMRSLQVGYTLPQHLTRKVFVNKFRVYFMAENLFTLTKYHGFDPEISSGGTSIGLDKGVYPQPRVLTFGLNLTI